MNVNTPKLRCKNPKSSPSSSLPCSPDVPDVLPVSINSLPAELLLSIFTDVYMESRVDGSGPHGHKPRTRSNLVWSSGIVNLDSDSESEMEETQATRYKTTATEYSGTWKKEHLYDPNNLFPYTLSFVCRRWRALAEIVPEFWTRLVIYVDFQPTSLSDIQSQLDVTGDLPLEVTVRRRPGTYSLADPEEYLRCRHVIELLMPHVGRFRMFTFDVISSSSLPSLSDDFHGAAPILWILRFKCRVDDGVAPGGPLCAKPLIEDPLSTPVLEELAVDGRNFVHACQRRPCWLASLHEVPKLFLHIFKFTPSPIIALDQSFSLNDFLHLLPNMPVIKKLSLNSVRFGAGGRDTLPAATVEISQITLRHISDAALVAAIIQYASVPNSFLQITSCPLGSINFIVSAWDLHLEAIDARENMETFLSLWTGDTLSVTDSLCFDDRALLAIGQNLDLELRISNCRNISVDGLKKMVKKLKRDHADDFPEHRTVFENLHLSRQGFMLSPEEKDWFYDNGIGTVM